ncbi:MAG: RidA family protein [Rhodospirillaceae bacterium]
MAYRRIRKYNTKETQPGQDIENDLCQAVVARGAYVFVRGQPPQDLDTYESVHIGDPAAQGDFAMRNVIKLLAEAGAKPEYLCKLTVYITDVRYRSPIYKAIGKHIKGIFPCQTGLVVQALARPEWLVEIDAEAVIPEGVPAVTE